MLVLLKLSGIPTNDIKKKIISYSFMMYIVFSVLILIYLIIFTIKLNIHKKLPTKFAKFFHKIRENLIK